MSVVDKFVSNHAGIHRKRAYPGRDKTLQENQELQKTDSVASTDGLRAFARWPEHELERLAEKGRTDKDTPSYYADLMCPDGAISSAAKRKLVNSSEGKMYRVGATNSKSFRFRNNPLAKG
jgi:hypothetical protein